MAFGRKKKAQKDETFQLVDGGHVRRIHFDDEYDVHLDRPSTHLEVEADGVEDAYEADETWDDTHVERAYRPRHIAPIDEIRFEVDHLESIRAGYRSRNTPAGRSDLAPRQDRTVYTTERGGRVIEARTPGGRKVLYTTAGSVTGSSRFTEKRVDEIIRGVDLDSEEVVVKETVTEYVPKSKAEGMKTETVKGKTIKRTSTKTTRKNKGGTDTKPRVAKAPDTKPGESAKPSPEGYQPQCAALTAAGKQCRNSSRKSSKYCGSHKGYRAK